MAQAQKSTLNSGKRYRSPLTFAQFRYDGNQQLVYRPLTGSTDIVASSAVQWLGRCHTFATIEEHAARLVEELGLEPSQFAAIEAVLNQLVESDMLISDEHFVEHWIGQATCNNPQAQISSLGVPTRNRPEELQRCLESYAQCQKGEREFKFIVSDQSDDIETCKTNLQLLEKLKKDVGINSIYIGSEEKAEFARQLANYAGVPEEIVSFALLNDDPRLTPYGANRNALLLATIGDMMLQVDDDTMCMLAPCPESTAGIVLTSQFNPTVTHFFSEKESTEADHGFSGGDVFALHELLLGKSIRNCVDQYNGDYNINFCDSSFFRKLQSRAVAVTFLGSGGELAIGTSYYCLHEEGGSRLSLVRSESDYYYAMSHQQGIRGVSCATISDNSWCVGLNLGLDNRLLLPPFMPVQRNEDGIFAHTIKAGGVGYFGFVPWMLVHKRASRMSNHAEVLADLRRYSATINSGNLLSHLIKDLTPSPDRCDARKNMIALGESLIDLGLRPLSEFEEMVRLAMLRDGSGRISSLESRLKAHQGQPPYWAKDVNVSLTAIREALAGVAYMVPGDLREVCGEEQARLVFQALVLKFGELLKVWPDLRQAAQELQERGVLIGKRV